MPACNLTCWSGLLLLSGEPACVYCTQGRELCIPTERWKKAFSLKGISNLSHREAGGPAAFAAQEVRGSTWSSS